MESKRGVQEIRGIGLIQDRVHASRISEAIVAASDDMKSLLRQCLSFQSVSGQEGPFVNFVERWAAAAGFETDLWETSEADLAKFAPLPARHLPLADRPTLVVRLRGNGSNGGRSLIFNAHSDVVSAGDPKQWRFGPWDGMESGGRVYGRGACDTKGPMVSALWAMAAIKECRPQGLAGDLLLELVPGEEDCVGLGTLTSLARGYDADGVVILEPTEGLPRNASRGGWRFEITTLGKAVHGTVKWLGTDAIATMRHVLDILSHLESRWNDRSADPLFQSYPVMRPVTVDTIRGGEWQGMVCDRCTCGGYLELLPLDDLAEWRRRMTGDLMAELAACGVDPATVEVRTSEQYDGHSTPAEDPFCRAAAHAVQRFAAVETGSASLDSDGTNNHASSTPWDGWKGFNSGCEAGLRFGRRGTPTLVWGPGSLAQAHAPDEFIDWSDLRTTATAMADFAIQWTGRDGN